MAVRRSTSPPPASNGAVVAKSLPVPLYHQIFLLLRDEIVSGQRAFGTLVPTEQELSRIYGVSRITARRSLDELAENRLVARKRRVGTRVIFQPPSPPLEASIEQALESLTTFGRSTTVKLVELSEEGVQHPISDALRLEDAERVFRAVRVRSLDGRPLGCITSFVPCRLGPAFTREQLEATPMLLLLEQAGHKVGAATQTVSATSADSTLAGLLDVEMRAPILRIARTVLSTKGEPILYTLAQYRSDRYQLRLDLHTLAQSADLPSEHGGVKARPGAPSSKPARSPKPSRTTRPPDSP